MLDGGHRARLAFEAAHGVGVSRELLGQRLDRDQPSQCVVPGEVDLPHAASAEQAQDRVAGNLKAFIELDRRLRQLAAGRATFRLVFDLTAAIEAIRSVHLLHLVERCRGSEGLNQLLPVVSQQRFDLCA